MSTFVASFTPVCRSLVLPASSGARPASRSWKPAAAFPASAAVLCRRPLSVTQALPEKHRPAFSIPPTALLCPIAPPDGKERWDIKEEGDYVKIWLQVPGLSENDLDITVSEEMLEIKRKDAVTGNGDGDDEAPADVHGVGSFHIRLLMTKEYDSSNVKAELKAGMLEVTVLKNKDRIMSKVGFGSKSPDRGSRSPEPSPGPNTAGSGRSPDKGTRGPEPSPGVISPGPNTGGIGRSPDKGIRGPEPSPEVISPGPNTGGFRRSPNKGTRVPGPSPAGSNTFPVSSTQGDTNPNPMPQNGVRPNPSPKIVQDDQYNKDD